MMMCLVAFREVARIVVCPIMQAFERTLGREYRTVRLV
jgi:hypothetical protein